MLPFALALLASAQPEPRALQPLPLTDLRLDGWLGARVAANREHWLASVDLAPRLQPFVQRPARQAWEGEHLGKWLHAAALAWAYSGDAALRERLDATVTTLLAAQEPDGYLGAYLPEQRFQLLPGADWDVWTIKYVLLGLLEVHVQTGDTKALAACRRAADLLLATFGPGRRGILSAGTHVGMAATSVLEPIARLYRLTGDARYLAFARHLVAAWDEPGGPRIASALLAHGRVARTANAKAYEMLSNLLGLCELHRATKEPALLQPVLAAFADIVANELLPTGSMSSHELFVGGGRLPAAMRRNLGEGCVTVTWMQLCAELLLLTGDARYGRELERAAYNHLPAAQRPDGGAFCYYTALRGSKPYSDAMTCCSSSGARGLALLPKWAVLTTDDTLVIALLEPAHGTATLGGQRVPFTLHSDVPRTGRVRLRFAVERPATFGVRVRLSEWAVPAVLRAGDEVRTVTQPGFVEVPARAWQADAGIDLDVRCALHVLTDAHDANRAAAQWGPCVLALPTTGVPGGETDRFGLAAAPAHLPPGPDGSVEIALAHHSGERRARFVPFAAAGAGGGAYRVWLSPASADHLSIADTARSRAGNVAGSFADGDGDSFVVTFDGERAAEDWYEIAFARAQPVRRVEFTHGHAFHDGGWFDASNGPPRVQVRADAGADWQTVGTLAEYPATTAKSAAGLTDGQRFALRLDTPTTAVAVRVVGVPAHGDAPQQAFSSCAEVSAWR